jgi:hypothetical protein
VRDPAEIDNLSLLDKFDHSIAFPTKIIVKSKRNKNNYRLFKKINNERVVPQKPIYSNQTLSEAIAGEVYNSIKEASLAENG